ncbi:MAG: hypothetical protein CMP50_04040 [Flavobacteriales bacterium]|nr:hypothetical protein [Flavobacteriales bacterium]
MSEIIIENTFYYYALISWIGLSIITFIFLIVSKPKTYGRHIRKDKFSINNRLGWFLMELPTVLLMPYFYFSNVTDYNLVVLFFITLYMIHYLNRVFIFPFRIKTKGKRMPLLVVFSAIVFNVCNTYLIGYYFGNLSPIYDISWFCSPYFIIGFIVFLTGAYINNHSDTILINLRKGSENEYKVPFGGLFKYVSCPNHFGEIIEWIGFSVLTCSLPVFAFALWTIANLIPRAIQHHNWYHAKFKDYPKERKAILPYLV